MFSNSATVITQLVERGVTDGKGCTGFRFDSQFGNVSFILVKTFCAFLLEPAVYPLCWTSQTNDLQPEPKGLHNERWCG